MNKTSVGLAENIASMLCYSLLWVSGIIFLIIEQENKRVRFHAIQSIITFGGITVILIFLSLLGMIPVLGVVFDILGWVLGVLMFVLWIVLMVKAYQGEQYRVPVAASIAEGMLPVIRRVDKTNTEDQTTQANHVEKENIPDTSESIASSASTIAQKIKSNEKWGSDYFSRTRSGRIAGYSTSIFWNVCVLIFFSFFHQYIAWYHIEPDGSVTRTAMLTSDYLSWLPILVTALVISIAANIIMIIYDKYWFREILQIIMSVIGVVVVANLVSIFPFDFDVIPNNTATDIVPIAVKISLIMLAVGLAVGALVRFIKLIVSLVNSVTS